MPGDASMDADIVQKLRLRLLGFSTSDMLANDLSRALAEKSIEAQISRASFGVVIPELLSPSSEAMDGIIIMLDVRGFYNRDWRRTTEEAYGLLTEKTELLLSSLEGFATSASGPVFINSLPSAVSPQAGFLDAHHPDGAGYLIHIVNQRLRELAERTAQITLIDADHAMADIAPSKRSDAKLWYYGRIAYSAQASAALAQGFATALAARAQAPIKVLALDLDNTLWRGIFGEDGVGGLECGDDFPGNAFKAFQEECLRLKSQGFLLTILSKNDEDALRVFDEHPGMALKRQDFTAFRINWEPKPDNIRAFAEDLDLSLNSFLFLDDSPHEREAMRRLAPEVQVPELPEDPAQRPDFLRNLTALWPLRLTGEDAVRSELYGVQAKGRVLKRQAASFEDYLAGLEQKLQIEQVSPATLPRIAQMHARTNQFNLTTRRLSETELATMMADEGGHSVFLGRLSDRFGDHGIVISAVLSLTDERAEILSFLMSCRVIGREVERAFLGSVLQQVAARGIKKVEAQYIPTEKNGQTSDFFKSEGFELINNSPSQTSWLFKPGVHTLPASEFITVTQVS